MEYQQSTVLVTGGATGIGLALARRFHARGCQVVVCGRRKEALDRCPQFDAVACDLRWAEQREQLAAFLEVEYPRLRILVNNAGIQRAVNLRACVHAWGDWTSELAINLEAPIHLTGLLLPLLMRQSGATIINVSSGLAFVPKADVPIYSATKAALHSFTQSLRYQLQGTPVEVLELVPPAVDTDLQAPGLHTFGVDVDEFAESVFERLERGEPEVGYGTSEVARLAPRREKDKIFKRLNPPRSRR